MVVTFEYVKPALPVYQTFPVPAQRTSLEKRMNAKHLFLFLLPGTLLCVYTVLHLIGTDPHKVDMLAFAIYA
jgi:hypothetical protein